MSVVNLITNAEADTFNALSSEWLALTADQKTAYIFNASLYMQTVWTCTDVDWTDTTTLSTDQQRACAYYAEADRIGVLYPAVEVLVNNPTGRLIEETDKAGSLESTKRWSETGAIYTGDPLESIDALMTLGCTKISSNTLIRV